MRSIITSVTTVVAALPGVAFVAPNDAKGAFTLYTTAASFDAAAPGMAVQNFEGAFSTGTSVSFSGFSANGGTQSLFQVSQFNTQTSTVSQILGYNTLAPQVVTFTFTPSINAFGFYVVDFGTFGTANFEVVINGTTFVAATSPPSTGPTFFFGVVSTTPFTTVAVRSTRDGDFLAYDDLRFGNVNSVSPVAAPLPPTLLAGVLGLASFAGVRRLRRA